jgi:hypothetical protein
MINRHESEFPGNTALHDAIHENNTPLALELINKDNLNVQALGNTPLLLALKKGNIVVAEALLNQPDIDINTKDGRGFTALHWACMLRQDKIIERLLELGANPHDIVEPWTESSIQQNFQMSPIDLYRRDIDVRHFTDYWSAEVQAGVKELPEDSPYYHTFFGAYSRAPVKRSGFADHHHLHIPGEMAFTDIIFHIKELCTNLKWINSPNRKFLTHEIDATTTEEVFRKNFGMGINDFCSNRNSIPVNPVLIEKMEADNLLHPRQPLKSK